MDIVHSAPSVAPQTPHAVAADQPITIAECRALLRDALAIIDHLHAERAALAAQIDACFALSESQVATFLNQRCQLDLLRDMIHAPRLAANDRRINEAHPVEEIVGRAVDLAPAGDGVALVGECPWCRAGVRSLRVFPAAGRWRCSACDANGTAIEFCRRWWKMTEAHHGE